MLRHDLAGDGVEVRRQRPPPPVGYTVTNVAAVGGTAVTLSSTAVAGGRDAADAGQRQRQIGSGPDRAAAAPVPRGCRARGRRHRHELAACPGREAAEDVDDDVGRAGVVVDAHLPPAPTGRAPCSARSARRAMLTLDASGIGSPGRPHRQEARLRRLGDRDVEGHRTRAAAPLHARRPGGRSSARSPSRALRRCRRVSSRRAGVSGMQSDVARRDRSSRRGRRSGGRCPSC